MKQVIAAMSAQGYIEPAGKPNTWRNTPQGDIVAGAKPPRLKRTSGDKALEELLDHVPAINSDDTFLYRVARAVVFGGYLTDHDHIQDIDIGVELQPKHKPEEQRRLIEKRIAEAEKGQEHFKSFLDEQHVAEKDVLAKLKARSRAINLHRLEDWMLEREHRVVFLPK